MEFSRTKLKVGVAQALCHPSIGKIISARFRGNLPTGGLRFGTGSPRIRDQEKAAIFWPLHEGAEIRFLRNCLRMNLDVVELDCNIGVTSSNIRSRLGRDRRPLYVEADHGLLDVTVRNLELNELVANFRPVHGAIDCDHEDPTVAFSVAPANIGGRVAKCFRQITVPINVRSTWRKHWHFHSFGSNTESAIPFSLPTLKAAEAAFYFGIRIFA
jgi:hypothetical protein